MRSPKTMVQDILTVIFGFFCFLLVLHSWRVPNSIDWANPLSLFVFGFLGKVSSKRFAIFEFSCSLAVYGIIIFEPYTTFYSLFYFAGDQLGFFWKSHFSLRKLYKAIPSYFINMMIVIIGNDFYNHTAQHYPGRFATLLILTILYILLTLAWNTVTTKQIYSTALITVFAPASFEMFVVYPLLAGFAALDYRLLGILLLAYWMIGNIMQHQLLAVSEGDVSRIATVIQSRNRLTIRFGNLGQVKGMYEHHARRITVNSQLDFPDQLQTLIHELAHHKLRVLSPRRLPMEEGIVMLLEAMGSWYFVFLRQIFSN